MNKLSIAKTRLRAKGLWEKTKVMGITFVKTPAGIRRLKASEDQRTAADGG